MQLAATVTMTRKRRRARITFERASVVVQMANLRFEYDNKPGGDRRRRYRLCQTHCVRLFDRALQVVEQTEHDLQEEQVERATRQANVADAELLAVDTAADWKTRAAGA